MAGNDSNTIVLCQFQDDIANDAVGGSILHTLVPNTPVNLKERYAGSSSGAAKSGTQYKYSYLGNNYSWYFDGTDDRVTVSANDPKLWISPTDRWRYSFWIYPTKVPSAGDSQMLLFTLYGGDTNTRWYLLQQYHASGNYLWFYGIVGGVVAFTMRTAFNEQLTVDSWNFVELNFDGTNINIFINGTKCTLTITTAFSALTYRGSLYLMSRAGSVPSGGYLSEFEFSKGADFSPNTVNYSVPTSDMVTSSWVDQSYDGYNKLYLPFDDDDDDHLYGTAQDYLEAWSENRPRIEVDSANYESPIVASTKQYLNGSCKFSTSFVRYADSTRFKPNENAWTKRYRLKFDSLPSSGSYVMIECQYVDANNRWFVGVYNDSGSYKFRFRYVKGSTEYAYFISDAVSLSTGVDYEIELNWDTSVMRLFVNGTQYAMNVSTAYAVTTSEYISGYLFLGEYNGTYNFVGYMYEYAMDKGQAIHTSAYTPSTDDFYSAGEINYTYCTMYIRFDFDTGYDDYYPVSFAPKFGTKAMLLKEHSNNGFTIANHNDFDSMAESGGKGTVDFWFCPVDKLNQSWFHVFRIYESFEKYIRIEKLVATWTYRWEFGTRNGAQDDSEYYIPADTDGAWVHVAFTWDFTNAIYQLYLNGTLVAEDTNWNNDSLPTGLTAALDLLSFGAVSSFARGLFLIQELRISNVRRYTGNFIPPTEPYTEEVSSTYYMRINESLSLSEFVSKSIYKHLSETINLTASIVKNITISISDLLHLSDSISKQGQKIVSDYLNIYDLLSRTTEIHIRFTDYLNLSDSYGKSIYKVVEDNIAMSESQYKTITKIPTDILPIIDEVSKRMSLDLGLHEQLNIADSLSKRITKNLNEQMNMSESLLKTMYKRITNVLHLSDPVSKRITKYIDEPLNLTDDPGLQHIIGPPTVRHRIIKDIEPEEDAEWHDITSIEKREP